MNILKRCALSIITGIKIGRLQVYMAERYGRLLEEEHNRIINDVHVPEEELDEKLLEAAHRTYERINMEMSFMMSKIEEDVEGTFPPNKKEQSPP